MGQFKGFSQVQLRKPKRSMFDLSHEKKLSGRMGKLIPVFIQETLPNDTFKVNTEVMVRFAPMVAPIYHRVNVFVHFFFVPNRLLWKDWEKFITNGQFGTGTPPVPPRFNVQDAAADGLLEQGTLCDYLGINPIPAASAATWAGRHFHAMPIAAYHKVWSDYYRDRNFVGDNQSSDLLPLPSGTIPWDTGTPPFMSDIIELRTRNWGHEYFTSALPWTQRGAEVLLPVEVEYLTTSMAYHTDNTPVVDGRLIKSVSNSGILGEAVGTGTGGTPVRIENIDSFSSSINDLRQAIRLQEWFERNAVGGSRYNESIMAHFARKTSDGRLQRAEYLGGGRVPVQIGEVDTTAWSEDADANSVPPGMPAGRATVYSNKNGFRYNCEEHGFVLGIMSVMPVPGYSQSLHRMFVQRDTFLDYPWPSFANLGEQEVFKYEVYSSPATVPASGTPAVFGYQSRYADWKYVPGTVHGDFRTTLDHWHLNRKFGSVPSLSRVFNEFEDELQDRIFAVAEVDTLWCYVYNNASVVRSLPYFGTPLL